MLEKKGSISTRSKIIHFCIVMAILVIILVVAGIIMLRYQVEGEKNPPFTISNLMVISTAEGHQKENPVAKWDFTIDQYNDIYISVNKNEKYNKKETIKKITIENITISKSPEKGTVTLYMPASEGLYQKEEKYKIQDKLEYIGSKTASSNYLEIANQGGVILLRCSNENISDYQSDTEEEIKHDGSLFAKTNTSLEQLKMSMSFDIIIETGSNITYKTTISLDLPIKDITTEGTSSYEKEDLDTIIFKRV